MSTDAKRTPRVVVVGAGLAGIAAAIGVKRKLNHDNFTIFEQASAVGGTWRDNTYPGCGSDVPGHWYSLSTDLNPHWQTHYASQPELRAYWEGLWHKYDLVRHTQLNTSVLSAVWNNEKQLYAIELQNMQTGDKRTEEAEVMIYAIGGFQAPLYPGDIPGKEEFKGEQFHSARWRHDVCLKYKRVGVIGNGCSAAQLIPEITEDPSVKLINFCRTPQWYTPRKNFRYPSWIQRIFAHVPFVMRFYRNWIMARSDLSFLLFRKSNKLVIKTVTYLLAMYIQKTAPKELVDRLTPDYAPGCKRIIVDPGYLKSLHRPNVDICWDGIERIVDNGIKLKTGEIVPLDIIIFGTGYSLETPQLQVRGSDGNTMHEYFASRGGPMAYLGSCVPGFPNLYILLGPNVASGHASVIFSEEAQIDHAVQLIRPIVERKVQSFEITHNATDQYNNWLQKRLQNSVWTDCISYYQADRGNKTRIIATFPGPVALFWWFCRHPQWNLYHAVGAERWKSERRVTTFTKWSLLTIMLSILVRVGLGVQGFLPPVASPFGIDWVRESISQYIRK